MANGTQSPFDGKPATCKFSDDQGRTCYEVKIEAMTPLRARMADWFSWTAALGAGVGGITLAFVMPEPNAWPVSDVLPLFLTEHITPIAVSLILAGPVMSFFAAKAALYQVMQKTVRVVFTPDEFVIHGLFGKKRFDRNLPHKFAAYPHHRAEREEKRLRFWESKYQHRWWSWSRKRYLGQSSRLSFDYMDQRNVIMTIFKHTNAQRIFARLNAVKDVMDNERSQGAGQALSPEQDWSPQAGALETGVITGAI